MFAKQHQGKKMETAVTWCLTAASILIGVGAAIIWGSGSKSVGLWVGFVPGAIALVFAAGFQVQHLISKAELPEKKPESPNRPWVSLRVGLAGPLAYDDKGWDAGTRWHLLLNYEMKNTGNTPAVGVEFFANLIPFTIPHFPPDRIKNGLPQGDPIPDTNVPVELKKMCDAFALMITHAGPTSGRTLFRGDSQNGRFQINGDPTIFDAAKTNRGFSGNFVILACATYRFTSEEGIHQTGEAFALFRPNGKINIEGETIPPNELGLVTQPMGGAFAN
jgi:hypothetical protein